MPQIQPSISRQELLCAETPAAPCGMVVFGGSGDLTRRKLIKSLFELYKRQLLPDQFFFLGCGRKNLSDDDYRNIAASSISDYTTMPEQVSSFLERIYFITGTYDDEALYQDITHRIAELD